MTANEARDAAKALNATGRYRVEWFYYPTWHAARDEWFVMRRPKRAQVFCAVFVNGEKSGLE